MRQSLIALLLGLTFAAGAARAEEQERPACKRAEVNPVTGHMLCIDPVGAPVEPPPDSVRPECAEQSRGQWTWAPNCTPEPEG
jgi:hypothetical protein